MDDDNIGRTTPEASDIGGTALEVGDQDWSTAAEGNKAAGLEVSDRAAGLEVNKPG